MPAVLARALERVIQRVDVSVGAARRRFLACRGAMRVLTYHGIVPDELASEPWVPSQAVRLSAFSDQMAQLAALGAEHVRTVGDAWQALRAAPDQAGPFVCVTFDDGLHDNFTLAYPVLKRYGLAATFYVPTRCLDQEVPFMSDRLRLLRLLESQGRLRGPVGGLGERLLAEPAFHKQCSRSAADVVLDDLWDRNVDQVSAAARRALRTMRWEDVDALHAGGMEIGAHTARHVILSREDASTRRAEIVESVTAVRERTGDEQVGFCYPNGRRDDYGVEDIRLLESLGVGYAVTQEPGWITAGSPGMEMGRQCIGLHHRRWSFLMEAFGGVHDRLVVPDRGGS